MQPIMDEFMEFSLEVTQRLKERIREEEDKPKKIIKITRYLETEVLEKSVMHDFFENPKKKTFPNPTNLLCVRYEMSKRARRTKGQASSSHNDTMEEKVCKFGLFDNEDHQMNYNNLTRRSIHFGDAVD
ncbi:hypothetical protein Tco_1397569 [Tanacetum coccineum]